ncbi:NAD(P)H-binding protein [Streptomyces sp. 549]|uniref:NAD(P)H-binding protein n=1 Tax=Streptomyces sp. 549 TaxID=3049076 RepID=UPI0024C3BB8F|nr:NAD(P)H-binding protein [Streptomyces sp. 549]MDK1474305.1 NAD(P)H-binding protein [Streptomyces sp. 549]
MTNELTLVTGATGKTGRRVAERLEQRGVPVRAVSRSAARPFDWADRSTWEGALEGVHRAYVAYAPDLGTSRSVDDLGAFTDRAVSAGVRHVVMLSARTAEAGLSPAEKWVREAEQAVTGRAPSWTVLRPGWFFQNFDEAFFLEAVRAGELALPAGEGLEGFIDAGDIADVAVAALLDEGWAGRHLELTGPELLSFGGAVAAIASASGREVRYVPLGQEEFAAMMAGLGLPEELTALLGDLLGQVRDGGLARLAGGVREVLGREPRSFADYAAAVAATGVWTA